VYEWIATVTPRTGGTQAVIVRAWSKESAIDRLNTLGYRNVRNVARN
jgi:hypothetical protein